MSTVKRRWILAGVSIFAFLLLPLMQKGALEQGRSSSSATLMVDTSPLISWKIQQTKEKP